MFDRKCSHCERAYPDICFDLHHTDPSQKEFHFNDLGGKCWARIEKEVSKCILLCSNCHRIEHDRLRKLTK